MVQELETINYYQLYFRGNYVYIIKSGEFVKIGYSSNFCSRLENLKSSNPTQMEIIGLFIGGRKEEAMLHNKFKQFLLRNEWFIYNEEIQQYCTDFTPIQLDAARNKMARQRSIKRY